METRHAPTDDVIRATPRGRAWNVALAACGVLLIALFWLMLMPLLNAKLAAPLTRETVRQLKFAFAGLAALGILPALFMMATGVRILHLQQFPLPNAWVWRDTQIKRGTAALRIGRFCIAAGALACVFCVAVFGYAWWMFDRMLPTHLLRPGVVILKESYQPKP